MMSGKFNFLVKDGTELYGFRWPCSDAKAHIYIVHGLGEHIGRYDHVASYFNSVGYSVSGMDLRGHGNSKGKRGDTPSYEAFLDDIDSFMKSDPQKCPIILYGHSMGGNLVLNYALRRKPNLRGLIATGPWIKLHKEPFFLLQLMGRAINYFGGFIQPNGLDVQDISTLEEEQNKYSEDPLVHDRVSSTTGIGVLDAGNDLLMVQDKFPCKMLLMHGADDKITSPKATEQLANILGKEFCTLKIWANLRHEIHNDFLNNEVLKYISDWLEEVL